MNLCGRSRAARAGLNNVDMMNALQFGRKNVETSCLDCATKGGIYMKILGLALASIGAAVCIDGASKNQQTLDLACGEAIKIRQCTD